jgi:hypothetical protein
MMVTSPMYALSFCWCVDLAGTPMRIELALVLRLLPQQTID